jgi:hypothetical protein
MGHEGQTWHRFFLICATVLGIVLALDFVCTNMKGTKLRRIPARSLPSTFMRMRMGRGTTEERIRNEEQQEQQDQTRDRDERKQAEEEEQFIFTFARMAPKDLEVKMTIETEVVVES